MAFYPMLNDWWPRGVSELETAEDIRVARIKLMAYRETIPTGPTEQGSGVWRARAYACEIETAITFRAVELGLETH